MKTAGYLIYCVIAIAVTIFLIFNKSKNEKQAFKEQYKNYVSAPGKITDKKQRIGPRAKLLVTYTVAYKTQDGKEYKQTSSNVGNGLADSYGAGDTLTVFYNPLNPYDPVVDRTGIEAGSEVFNYNNIVPYAAGMLILIGAFFLYRRRNKASK